MTAAVLWVMQHAQAWHKAHTRNTRGFSCEQKKLMNEKYNLRVCMLCKKRRKRGDARAEQCEQRRGGGETTCSPHIQELKPCARCRDDHMCSISILLWSDCSLFWRLYIFLFFTYTQDCNCSLSTVCSSQMYVSYKCIEFFLLIQRYDSILYVDRFWYKNTVKRVTVHL